METFDWHEFVGIMSIFIPALVAAIFCKVKA